MQDLDRAIRELKDRGLTLCMVREGQVIYSSREKGIAPLYRAMTDPAIDCRGASAADRIVGKGAALFFVALGIRALHTQVVSEEAMSVLAGAGIPTGFDQRVPRIENRDRTGLCPIETLALHEDSAEDLLPRVKAFLQKVGALV